jgi:alpha-glucoside transport system substrate-binding protein
MRMKHSIVTGRLAVGAAMMGLVAAACGSSSTPGKSASSTPATHVGGSLNVWAEWTTTEQTNFLDSIKPFETSSGVTVNYASKGSNTDTAVETAVTGGAPPDVAFLPDPGAMDVLAKEGALQPISSVIGSEANNFSQAWQTLGSYNGTLYGIWYKAANKNTIWYNPAELAQAGISSAPTTWEDLVKDAGTLHAAGIPAFALCTDIGWPVADLWQNVYLKTAGADSYNKLANYQIKWTDPTVTTSFNTLDQILNPAYLDGGTAGFKFPDCVNQVFPTSGAPKAAMVIEADFVTASIPSNYKAVSGIPSSCSSSSPCYGFFPFPAPAADSSNNSAIQAAGDVALMLKKTPQAEAFMKYLAGAQGAKIWAGEGGYTSPNTQVPTSAYPNPVLQADAKNLQDATASVFSLDDEQKWEHDMWADMLSYLKSPSSLPSIQATMDSQASAAGQT